MQVDEEGEHATLFVEQVVAMVMLQFTKGKKIR